MKISPQKQAGLRGQVLGGGSCSDANIGSTPISLSASGTTVIIPAAAGVSVHLCLVSIAFASAVNVTLQKTTSGGASTALTGAYQLTSGNLLFEHNYNGAVLTGLGNGFSISLSSAVVGGGVVTFFISHTN